MSMIVVSGDGRLLDPDVPLLHADDLAALRGDGVFETLLVRDARALLVEPHLDRLAEGAAALALPAPDVAALAHAIDVAAREWADAGESRIGGAGEGMLRVAYSRGRESAPDGPPTAYVTVGPVAARVAQVRRAGISAITLDRGFDVTAAAAAPWLLAGIKALAYAGNAAALRHAVALGADDALFLGADGTVLEGPRSSVVIERDGALLTPPRSLPILPGTTVAALFAHAAAAGIETAEERFTVDELHDADGVWLLSSVTLAAHVNTLDGAALASSSTVDVPGLVEAAVSVAD
ncbi:MAG: aminodeoxychorismate lyase [Gordonia sp. (in: high G+C Gram-positive bacteria)]|uniref:aminodeoxychorismate lyase n=1 Tax=Gordonia sp. (in: high G+C Gram-positive bacteria) TaxID=84139 RepID=UPI0039E2BC75